MNIFDSTLSLADAPAVVPCRVCGNPTRADQHNRYCPDCYGANGSLKYAIYARNRKARKVANGGTHTAQDVRDQYDRQKGKCFYCHIKVGDRYHVDHVVPLMLGGSDGPENLVIACVPCNAKKSYKHPMDFAGILL